MDLLQHPRIRIAVKEQQLLQREAALNKREEAIQAKEELLAKKEEELLQRVQDSSRQPFSKISPNSVRLNRPNQIVPSHSSTPIKQVPSHPGTPLSTLATKMKSLSIVTPGRPEVKSSGSLASAEKWLGPSRGLSTPRYKGVKPFQSPMQTSP